MIYREINIAKLKLKVQEVSRRTLEIETLKKENRKYIKMY